MPCKRPKVLDHFPPQSSRSARCPWWCVTLNETDPPSQPRGFMSDVITSMVAIPELGGSTVREDSQHRGFCERFRARWDCSIE